MADPIFASGFAAPAQASNKGMSEKMESGLRTIFRFSDIPGK